MIGRPIGLSHGEHCDSGDWDDLCDDCREQTTNDWED